jgi:hypothetical protein
MNALYVSLITSTWFFLIGWIVMLLVACALAFRSEVLTPKTPRSKGEARPSSPLLP